ncbi:MAG: carbonic anhydrase [Spirochaetota bacterium]|nr:carbonic anhydrase [Spirochaetota bacterium]
MGIIDDSVRENEAYASSFTSGDLTSPPSKNLAVVACMDARMNVENILGIKLGEAHIIRNAGGSVTEDALRSLIVSTKLLGTKEFMIINHTDCGMMKFKDEDLKSQLLEETGTGAVSPSFFYPFKDLEANVREQIQKVKTHPWIPDSIVVRGFVYDVKTGKLSEVK